MTKVGFCPHCRAANSFAVGDCIECKQPLPWADVVRQHQQEVAQAQTDLSALKQSVQNAPINRTSVASHSPVLNSRVAQNNAALGQSLPVNPFHIFIDAFLGRFAHSFENVDKQSAMWIGVVSAFIYNLCLIVGTYLVMRSVQESLQSLLPFSPPAPISSEEGSTDHAKQANFYELWQLAVISLAPMLAVTISCTIARKLFGGEERWLEGDVYIAGISLLPTGFFVLGIGILGWANIEVIAIGFVFTVCYTIMLLYRGLTTVSKVRDMAAALCVPLVIILSSWLVKIVSARLMSF